MKFIIIILLIFIPFFVVAQNIKGIVIDKDKKPISGVSVCESLSNIGTITSKKGEFSLLLKKMDKIKIIVEDKKYYKLEKSYIISKDTLITINLRLKDKKKRH